MPPSLQQPWDCASGQQRPSGLAPARLPPSWGAAPSHPRRKPLRREGETEAAFRIRIEEEAFDEAAREVEEEREAMAEAVRDGEDLFASESDEDAPVSSLRRPRTRPAGLFPAARALTSGDVHRIQEVEMAIEAKLAGEEHGSFHILAGSWKKFV